MIKRLMLVFLLLGDFFPDFWLFRKFGSFWRYFFAKKYVAFMGANVNVQKRARFSSLLKIGDNSGLGESCRLVGPITIGKNVMMGKNVLMLTQNHAHDRVDIPMIEQGYEPIAPIEIEDDVWIGERVIILPGVHLHKGTIVGAGAVVTKSPPPYSIIGGSPAKVLKMRN